MRHNDPEEWAKSFQLSLEVIKELTIRSIVEANLSDIEQLVFSLRHRLTDEGTESNLREMEEIAFEVYQDIGERISSDTTMSLLERAEAKVDKFVWDTLEKAIRQYLGMSGE